MPALAALAWLQAHPAGLADPTGSVSEYGWRK